MIADLAERLAVPGDKRILLVVLDGIGGVPKQNKTELEAAWIPNLDRLAARSSLGLTVPIAPGVTPGSGPAHLALFGYDPVSNDIGRGVLEALGIGLDPGPGDICGRGNFATLDSEGKVTDRRAGRIDTETCARLAGRLQEQVGRIDDVDVVVRPGREHRFVVVFRGPGLLDGLTDSDPQHGGVPPNEVAALRPEAEKAARVVNEFADRAREALKDEERANGVLLRGLASPPRIGSMKERYGLKAACVAVYPMYRGLARLVGMDVLDAGQTWESEINAVRENRDRYDFIYLHFKDFDKAGEDGDFNRKVELIERFDEEVVPRLGELKYDVLCIAGDHSTPAVLGGHSWHSVPFLLHSPWVRPQVSIEEFGERACARGNLGMFEARHALTLMLAHAGRLKKFGA